MFPKTPAHFAAGVSLLHLSLAMRCVLSFFCFTFFFLLVISPSLAQFTPADGGPKAEDGIELLHESYQEFELFNGSTSMPERPEAADFNSIKFVTLGKTRNGSSYGTGTMHLNTLSGKKTTSMVWCLILHPDDQGFFILCISPKPYKSRDRIIRFAIGTQPNRMAKLGEAEAFFRTQ